MRLGARWLPALAAALLAWPAGAAELELPALMEMLAQVASAKDAFTETKHSAMLSAPLQLKGTLLYVRPDRLEKQVTAPYVERTVIAGDSVTVENRSLKQTRSFSLGSSPAISAFVESMRATLAGDLATLQRHYAVQLEGQREAWVLTLTPREEKLAGLVARIRISGARERLKRIEIEETAGDRTVTLIGPALP